MAISKETIKDMTKESYLSGMAKAAEICANRANKHFKDRDANLMGGGSKFYAGDYHSKGIEALECAEYIRKLIAEF